jgi:hypothetical protein
MNSALQPTEKDETSKQPLVNKNYQLEKFPGKGGWTYAIIPEISPDKKAYFGWVKVKGSIKNHHLMPMGNGKLFLPVKASIRKSINKEAGDWVQIVLYSDESVIEVPNDLLLCLKDEPLALENFYAMNEGEKKAYIEWIYDAKKDETKVSRMAKTIDRLIKNLSFGEK